MFLICVYSLDSKHATKACTVETQWKHKISVNIRAQEGDWNIWYKSVFIFPFKLWITQSLVLPCKIFFVLSTFSDFQSLFHELLNQYQACLFLLEYISHVDFKYGHDIPKLWTFLKIWWHFDLSPAYACRMESIEFRITFIYLFAVTVFCLLDDVHSKRNMKQYFRNTLQKEQDADTPNMRRNTPLVWLRISHTRRTSCMEFICYGWEIIITL